MRSTLIVISAAALFLALTGFDCASTEMTTAKVAIKQKDFDKAEASLKKELAARPQNGEAWNMLSEIYEAKKMFPEMLDAQNKALAATLPALSQAEKDNIYYKRYNLWVASYEAARGAYVKALKGDDKAGLQDALQRLDMATTLRPDYAENIYLRAAILHELKDRPNETKANKDYIEAVKADVDRGVAAGLAIGMKPDQVIAKLGKPAKSAVDSTGGFLRYATDDLVIYFEPAVSDDPTVVGWKYFKGVSVPERLKENTWYLRSAPTYTLGIDAYYAADELPEAEKTRANALYDEALRYLQAVQKFDMTQDRVGQVIADIYGRTNRTAEAKAAFEENIRQNPNDPSLYINYGTLLVNLKDYTGAIENFKKVLTVADKSDSKYHDALFNLGAVYKNWGADLQKAAGVNPSAKQIDEFSGKLRESANYFEQYRTVHGKGDFGALSELANLYVVLDKKSELRGIVGELESLRADNERNADYWNTMSGVYARINDIKKAEEAAKKADSLMK